MMHQRSAFPRLYVPPRPRPMEAVEMIEGFHGKRSPFGPVTIYCLTNFGRHVEGHFDWLDDRERGQLAHFMLDEAGVNLVGSEASAAYAEHLRQVLAADEWTIGIKEVEDWYWGWNAVAEITTWKEAAEDDGEE